MQHKIIPFLIKHEYIKYNNLKNSKDNYHHSSVSHSLQTILWE
jgi:hypothetical protein